MKGKTQSKKNLNSSGSRLSKLKNKRIVSSINFSNSSDLDSGHFSSSMGSSSYSISDSFNGSTWAEIINKHNKENNHKREESIEQSTCLKIQDDKEFLEGTNKMPNNTKSGCKETDPPVKILSRGDILGAINCILPELDLKSPGSDERGTNFLPSDSFFSDDPLELKEVFFNARKYREKQRIILEVSSNLKKHEQNVDNNFMQSEGKNVHHKPEEHKSCRIKEVSSYFFDMSSIWLDANRNNLSNVGFNEDNRKRCSYSSILKGDTPIQAFNNIQNFFKLQGIENIENYVTEHSINYNNIHSKKPNIVNKQKIVIKYDQEEIEKLLEDNINKILDDDSLPKELSDMNMNDSPEIRNNTDFMEISSVQPGENPDISVLTNDINDISHISIKELKQNSKNNHDISNKSDISTKSSVESHRKPISHYSYARRHFPLFRNNSNPKTKTHFNHHLNPDYILLCNLRRKNDPDTISINIRKNNQAAYEYSNQENIKNRNYLPATRQ